MSYTIHGTTYQIEEPRLVNGKHYVPLADIVESLGGKVQWDNETKSAIATIGQWTADVGMDAENVDVNGRSIHLSAPAMLENDKMYVPYDFFNSVFGYMVELKDKSLDIRL